MAQKQERKTIEIDRKRIPLRTLLNGKEIREAAKALEDFRMKLNEKEFLYGAKIHIKWEDYDTVYAVARRFETDKEFADRLEKQRLAAEAKAERERRRKAQEVERALQREARKKADAAAMIKQLAKEAGISINILE